jgi:hypothetical protein
MKLHTLLKSVVLKAAVLVFSLFSITAMAGNTNVAGQFKATYAKQEALPIPDGEGHMLLLSEAHGSNTSTGKVSYMDGAQIVNKEILDLIQGNGPHSGYVTMSKDGQETVTKWSGKVTTVLNKDGTPSTTFKGNWEKVSGTGKFQATKGSGDYSGYFTSQKDYVVDWDGYLSGL